MLSSVEKFVVPMSCLLSALLDVELNVMENLFEDHLCKTTKYSGKKKKKSKCPHFSGMYYVDDLRRQVSSKFENVTKNNVKNNFSPLTCSHV